MCTERRRTGIQLAALVAAAVCLLFGLSMILAHSTGAQQGPDLSLDAAVEPVGSVAPGTLMTYTVTVTNTEHDEAAEVATAQNITVTVDLSTSTAAFLLGTPIVSTGNFLTTTNGVLWVIDPGFTGMAFLRVNALPTSGGMLTNVVSAFAEVAITNSPINLGSDILSPATATPVATATAVPTNTAIPTPTVPVPPPPDIPEPSSLLLFGSGTGGLATWLGWQYRRRIRRS